MTFAPPRQFSCPVAEELVAEAHTLANFLIEAEGACNVALCIHRASCRYGIEPGALHSLRYRWRELHDVKASTLERLRAAYEHVYEKNRRIGIAERAIEHEIATAELETVE